MSLLRGAVDRLRVVKRLGGRIEAVGMETAVQRASGSGGRARRRRLVGRLQQIVQNVEFGVEIHRRAGLGRGQRRVLGMRRLRMGPDWLLLPVLLLLLLRPLLLLLLLRLRLLRSKVRGVRGGRLRNLMLHGKCVRRNSSAMKSGVGWRQRGGGAGRGELRSGGSSWQSRLWRRRWWGQVDVHVGWLLG